MSRHLSTRNISSKSMHAILSNLAHRQTDRQTDKRTQAQMNVGVRTKTYTSLSEVNFSTHVETTACQSWREFLSASLYFSKRGAYWDRLCRDVVGRWLVGCHARALWPTGAS